MSQQPLRINDVVGIGPTTAMALAIAEWKRTRREEEALLKKRKRLLPKNTVSKIVSKI